MPIVICNSRENRVVVGQVREHAGLASMVNKSVEAAHPNAHHTSALAFF